ncbi:CASP8 and FADD-like apoptosis regulator [Mastacembelus armatus]|uniref:CASP8 and FADD like apoptosis regulator n=1 Tax=Mastacembelus armatus TaxID=205130 RepID=A0A3Q3NAP6_9TELE|nr:CASP8 and FADD-like apoptosis regulator [Mastacembelus armatus]
MAFHQDPLQVINQIAEDLSTSECRTLSYLCESLEPGNSGVCVKEILKSKAMSHENSYLFLAQLMVHLGRLDILRKWFKTSRGEMETYRQVLPRFRVLMANISQDMGCGDLRSMKFLLSSTLPREKIENSKNFLDLVIELEKLDLVSPERVDFIEKCLKDIDRVDLSKKVAAYKSVAVPELQSSQQRSARSLCPAPSPNGSHCTLQTRQVQSFHTAHIPVPVYTEQNYESHNDRYNFNSNCRGVCVIIDCVGNDGEMLEQTFKALHFKVILHKWLGVNDTLSELQGIFRQRENRKGDGFVCCIISRGRENRLLCTDSCSEGISLKSVRQLFTADACPVLAGKPKLFFIQLYTVPAIETIARTHHRDADLETDGCDGLYRYDYIPTDADVFWSQCYTEECQLQQRDHRSIYLKGLTDALQKGQRRNMSLVHIHAEVNGAVFEHNKKNPGAKYHIDLKHTLRKDIYLQ